jgi:DNA-binding response OmpR family regulator
VLAARDSREAKDFSGSQEDIGVVLLDLPLPGLSGGDVLEQIRLIKLHVTVMLTSVLDLESAGAPPAVSTLLYFFGSPTDSLNLCVA